MQLSLLAIGVKISLLYRRGQGKKGRSIKSRLSAKKSRNRSRSGGEKNCRMGREVARSGPEERERYDGLAKRENENRKDEKGRSSSVQGELVCAPSPLQ